MASRNAAELFLFQYDEANKILHGKDVSDLREKEEWSRIEGIFLRALKYIVELICILEPLERSRVPPCYAGEAAEVALALAENALYLGEMSHRVFSVFLDAWSLDISNDGGPEFDLRVKGEFAGFDVRFQERLKRDRQSRRDFAGWPQFDIHTDTHARYLNAAFTSSFGRDYSEFIAVLFNTINGSRAAPNGFPTPFIHRGKLLEALATSSGLPRSAIDIALSGFTVSAEHLLIEKRVVYRPKQESRAFRRGFFLFPHETGPHLAFSKAMAKESLIHLCNSVCYRRLPREWLTPVTGAALTELSQRAGKWFEGVVHKNLADLRFSGMRCKDSIGKGSQRLVIPSSVGEIDFLGFHPDERILLVVEAKMALTGLEGTFWRDDLSEFARGEKSYAAKFRRKISWVQEHRDAIAKALGVLNSARFRSVMITLYPCIAAEVITDFQCVSLTEFMLDYHRKGIWPYL